MKLTATNHAAILSLHCNSGVGLGNPFETGAKTPLLLVVFSFLPAVFVTGLFRAKFVMTGLFFGETYVSPHLFADFQPDKEPRRQISLETVCGVFSRTGNI